ncbi:MAG TPA: MerR family transcriptional regulator [Thermoanaerobaculia bacterium]|nr:MerR family transcriptional regulator [Thermoanaerobaculia bacterium]
MSETKSASEARYKVAEVCRLADVQPYVLRYWESEFPVLAAPKGASGPRLYSALELKIIERIKKLLYDEGYTIAGAKKRLEAELKEGEPPAAEPEPLVLTAPAPEPSESTGTRRRRTKSAPPPEPEPPAASPEPVLELSEAPILATHAVAPSPEPSIPLEIDESPAAAVDVDDAPPVKTAPVVRKIDPAPAPMAQSPDPRVAMALAELKEIASLLSREDA